MYLCFQCALPSQIHIHDSPQVEGQNWINTYPPKLNTWLRCSQFTSKFTLHSSCSPGLNMFIQKQIHWTQWNLQSWCLQSYSLCRFLEKHVQSEKCLLRSIFHWVRWALFSDTSSQNHNLCPKEIEYNCNLRQLYPIERNGCTLKVQSYSLIVPFKAQMVQIGPRKGAGLAVLAYTECCPPSWAWKPKTENLDLHWVFSRSKLPHWAS